MKSILVLAVVAVAMWHCACADECPSDGTGRGDSRTHAIASDTNTFGRLSKKDRLKINGLSFDVSDVELCTLIHSVVFGPQPKVPVTDIKAAKAFGEDIRLPMDWTCRAFKFRKNGYNINSFCFLDQTFREYEKTGDEGLLKIIENYINDFIASNVTPKKGQWAWYDDAIARRVQRLSYYLYYHGKDFEIKTCEKLRTSLAMQADVLLNDEYYRFKHNHGMFQDLGLIVYSILICDDAVKRDVYLDKACTRLLDYFSFVYTSDGVHKEHSPGYEREVQDVVRVMATLLKNVRPEFSRQLMKYVGVSARHLAALTKPDGTLPGIGDSRVLKHIECGQEDAIFKNSGYAVLRSPAEGGLCGKTWILFIAATHGNAHKHSDDLSFLLYHKGDLFVEAGMRNYDYLNEQTTYTYSGYAHNVLCINDMDFPVKTQSNGFRMILPSALNTHITDFSGDTNVRSVTGVQERFPDVTQRRTLRYAKQSGVVEILDQIISKKDVRATLLFHVDPEVSVVMFSNAEGNGLEFIRPFGRVAHMRVLSDLTCKLRVILGEGFHPYHTWLFKNDITPCSGPLILVDVDCHEGVNEICTRIQLY